MDLNSRRYRKMPISEIIYYSVFPKKSEDMDALKLEDFLRTKRLKSLYKCNEGKVESFIRREQEIITLRGPIQRDYLFSLNKSIVEAKELIFGNPINEEFSSPQYYHLTLSEIISSLAIFGKLSSIYNTRYTRFLVESQKSDGIKRQELEKKAIEESQMRSFYASEKNKLFDLMLNRFNTNVDNTNLMEFLKVSSIILKEIINLSGDTYTKFNSLENLHFNMPSYDTGLIKRYCPNFELE